MILCYDCIFISCHAFICAFLVITMYVFYEKCFVRNDEINKVTKRGFGPMVLCVIPPTTWCVFNCRIHNKPYIICSHIRLTFYVLGIPKVKFAYTVPKISGRALWLVCSVTIYQHLNIATLSLRCVSNSKIMIFKLGSQNGSLVSLWKCFHVNATENNTDSGNDLVPSSKKPLSEPM